jgi:glucuronoarabinoxylan endo-1,4-beta-xylanase
MKNFKGHKLKPGFVRFLFIFLYYAILLFLLPVISFAADALVDWGTTHQSIRGFGASTAWSSSTMPAALADLFFRTDGSNIGLSIYRTRVPPDGTLTGEMGSVQEALQRNSSIIVWAAPWSPPAAMKSTDNVNCDVLVSTNYQAYANYLTKYVQTMDASLNSIVSGTKLYALSVQNEPDWNTCSAGYEGCTWTADQIHSFILNNLGPAMQASCPDTKLLMPESFGDSLAMSDPTLNDSAAAAYVGIVGEHMYGLPGNEPKTPNPYPLAVSLGKEYWETEFYNNSLSSYDATMTEGLKTAVQIHNALTIANFNAYHYWWMISSGNDNGGLVPSGCASAACAPKTLYCLGNFSKFIRPGYVRIDTTLNPTSGVYVSAYKLASTGEFVIVAINTNAAVTSQKFDLNAMTTTSVIPYQTDASNNIAQQASAAVTAGSFTYNLPASSVMSFTGTSGNITVTPTFTPTASPVPATVLLDDMEDGNNTNNWGGAWYDYVDTTGSTIAPQPYVMTAGGAPNSPLYCASITGNIVTSGYGGLGTNLNSAGTAVDLTNYIGVQFYVKGSGTYWFQLTQPTITGGYFGTQFTANSTWTLVTVLFSNLTQEYGGPAAFTQNSIIALQWTNYTTGAQNLQVDDVKMLTNVTPTNTPNNTPSFTPTSTQTNSFTPTFTLTRTPTYTLTFTPTITKSATPSFTNTAFTSTPTSTSTPTNTFTHSVITSTFTATITANTPTFTLTPSNTSTPTLSLTAPADTPSFTYTLTSVFTLTPTLTATATPTKTQVESFTITPTNVINTPTITESATSTSTPTFIQTPAASAVATATQTLGITATATLTDGDAPITYPNPAKPGTDNIKMNITIGKYASEVKFMMFTPGYRLVREISLGSSPQGMMQADIDKKYFSGLANSVYYFIIDKKYSDGTSAATKSGKIILIN